MVLQLHAVHAVYAGPAPLHPVELAQCLDDGSSSIQVSSILSGLHHTQYDNDDSNINDNSNNNISNSDNDNYNDDGGIMIIITR